MTDARQEEVKGFAEKVVFSVLCDHEKRTVSVTIPENSPTANPKLYTAAQKEEMIINEVRRQIRELLRM